MKKTVRKTSPPARSIGKLPPSDPFARGVAANLARRCGITPGSGLLIAVSGGADSLAALAACAALAPRKHLRYRLTIAHIHHHLRPEAALEADAVRRLADALGLPFLQADITPKPGRRKGLAADARRLRYEALASLARQADADAAVTGHHGTDQLETLLLNLLRGAGPAGLAAMGWRESIFGLTVVRPLLDRSHEECVDLCRRLGWPWFDDPTNSSPASSRALLRREVLPLLRTLQPDIDQRICRTTDLQRQLVRTAQVPGAAAYDDTGTIRFRRSELREVSELAAGWGLREAARRLGCSADRLGSRVVRPVVEAVMDRKRLRRTFDWPCGLEVLVEEDTVSLRRETLIPESPPKQDTTHVE